jgi:UDP:flavonoid glycosyltransferase YjiC (YdhE family)
MLVKDFNKIAKKYNVKSFRCLNDILLGDYTIVCDDIYYLGLKPTEEFPLENYVGPIISGGFSQEEQKIFDADVKNFLKKPGRSILFTMGSFGIKKLFLSILDALNKTDFNVIATYTKILREEELPKLNDNILLKKFITNIKTLNQLVDLAIISGGRGTVYTAAFSGKPAIGIPLHIEQQYNIDTMVRYGNTIRLSKKYFTEKNLLSAIYKIFNNYNKYLKNAQLLKSKLPEPKGEENAAKRILEIVTAEVKNRYR